MLAAYPSTVRGVGLEIQQSTGATAASSRWSSVFMPPSTRGPLFYTANLPLSTKRYYFRARHTGGGYSAGAFTPTVSARPVVIPEWIPPVTVNAAGNVEVPGASLLVSSAATVKVGSQNTTSYITKTLRIPYTEFRPASTARSFVYSQYALDPNVSSTAPGDGWTASFVLPKGVTLSGFRSHAFRASTKHRVRLSLLKSTDATANTLCVADHDGATPATGWQTKDTTSVLNQLVGDQVFTGLLRITSTGSTHALFQWIEVDYRMPSYDKGI